MSGMMKQMVMAGPGKTKIIEVPILEAQGGSQSTDQKLLRLVTKMGVIGLA